MLKTTMILLKSCFLKPRLIKTILVFSVMCLSYIGFSQNKRIINEEATSYTLGTGSDSITFIVIDKDIKEKKPVFLWCQGSLPLPLYINFEKEGLWMMAGGISNFDYQEIVKYYHLVVVSMPYTPLIVEQKEVNDSYWYFGNSGDRNTPTLEFQKGDYLENYTNRAIKVLDFLKKQNWVDNSKLIVAGHSQGSKVALDLALKYKRVSKLGLFGFNSFGRIDQLIRQARKDAENKNISWEEADKKIERLYQFYRDANEIQKRKENPDLIAWHSFSTPTIERLVKIDKPIYLAYGTADIVSDLCDLIPLYFIREQKDNLTYKRYSNLEHNFFEVNEGKVDHEKPHWKKVMATFVEWSLK
ncbi:alpha/beta hydrolase family protein [Sphingobacterium faecale]|uniref:Alpha/beta hydrolase n=1 Tax=Sphingobacterium faecale TaxID=2803775 RepID=A0ABS1R173_9SPHI|nr:hypothetical protein [Sphingobacterium faecale]MBL1408440.1 hypothetical protein [Sphingobacterium faecale]